VNEDADATFVSDKTYRTKLGYLSLDNISPDIMFSIPDRPKRPPIPLADRYVAVSWIQGGSNRSASLEIVIPRTGRVIKPYGSGVVDGNYYAEFAVPRTLLTHKAVLVFTISGESPGVVGLRSLAWADYQLTKSTIDDLASNNIAPDAQSVEQLRKLRLLDPTLGGSRHVSISSSAHTPEPTASPAPTSEAWSGGVYDVATGRGSIAFYFNSLDATKNSWSSSFADGGSIEFLPGGSAGYAIFKLHPKDDSGCTYLVKAYYTNANMNGSYFGLDQCSRKGGSFTLTKSD
jgi:hypothetical protein